MTTPTAVERWKEAEPSLRAEYLAVLLETPTSACSSQRSAPTVPRST